MKNSIAALVLASLSLGAFAQDPEAEKEFSLTCAQMYQKTVEQKELKENAKQNQHAGIAGVAVAIPVNPAFIGVLLGAVIAHEYKSWKDDSVPRAFLLQDAGKALDKLTKRLQKKIDPTITSEEVLKVIRYGLTTGRYCENFPTLYSDSQIKRHVVSVLKYKYLKQ